MNIKRKLGLKNLLILSVVLLVGLSVSISNYVLFLQDKNAITQHIIKENTNYVHHHGTIIENFMNEKISGISQLAGLYKDNELLGTEEEIIELTKVFAQALNTGSVTIAFETGHAYWNQSNTVWPNNHLAGDVRDLGWYQIGRQATEVTITDPYLGLAKEYYWVAVLEQIKNGVISTDLTLEFLNDLVIRASEKSGTAAVILDSNTTVLATSSPALDLGKKAISYKWFEEMAKKTISQDDTTQDYVLNGEEKIYFAHRLYIGDRNWYFCIGVSKAIVFAKLERTVSIAIATATTSVIISMILAFIILQILYRPILELKKTILGLSTGDGDLTQRLAVTTDDDLGQIAQGINLFIDKIKELLIREEDESSLSLTKNKRDIDKLSDTFTQRWKDAFEQYRSRIAKEEELREELKLDALTKLPTRSYFEILLGDAIRQVYSEKSELLLVTVNVSNYELVAENFTNDQMQSGIFELTDLIEKILPKNVFLSRTGQAEFSIICKSNNGESYNLNDIVQSIAIKLKNIETQAIIFQCKLGASHLSYTDEKPTVSGLFYQVNNALYSIGDDADKNYAFYHKAQDIEKEQRQALFSDFKAALKKENELELYFQPQVNIITNKIIGAEALIRWNHPQKGLLTPDKFVYILDDDLQLNMNFGEWLIESALEKLSVRKDLLTISINVTPSHLQKEQFFKHLKHSLDVYPLSIAKRLKIELTETASISDLSRINVSMRKCRELGVSFSLDDFGTGYSTLSQLRILPASELKIDRSFVQFIETSEDDKKMIQTMIMMAKNFDIGVVVEGIENKVQQDILKELGASIIQGYFYSRPIPYKDFDQWLNDRKLS